MNDNQSGLAYGIIRKFENGTTLWYEPITDEIDGFVLRENKGCVQTVYSEKREAYIMDCKDENIIDVFPKRNKMEQKGYCGNVSDKRKNPYPIGSIRIDGITPSDEFLEFAEKEKRGEITDEDIDRVFLKKHTVNEK